VDLKRQREMLETRKEKAAGAKGELVDETALRKWAMEKLDRLGEALDGNLSPLETRRVVHSYVSHIDIDPYACTGTMFMVPDALAALEAESIRRVNVSSQPLSCQTTRADASPAVLILYNARVLLRAAGG